MKRRLFMVLLATSLCFGACACAQEQKESTEKRLTIEDVYEKIEKDMYVKVDGLRAYKNMALDATVQTRFSLGDKVFVKGFIAKEWYEVQLEDGTLCYVTRGGLSFNEIKQQQEEESVTESVTEQQQEDEKVDSVQQEEESKDSLGQEVEEPNQEVSQEPVVETPAPEVAPQPEVQPQPEPEPEITYNEYGVPSNYTESKDCFGHTIWYAPGVTDSWYVYDKGLGRLVMETALDWENNYKRVLEASYEAGMKDCSICGDWASVFPENNVCDTCGAVNP